jgi:hypothetical protein
MTSVRFDAPPTIARFMSSEAFGRLIAGPVGSAKTTGCIFELFRRAAEQIKAPDGYRYTRFAIVRQTLKQLKDTVLKDILAWLGQISTYKVSDNTIYIEAGDIRSEWLLIPLDDPEDQRRLLSMQLTGAWMSECIEMDIQIIDPLSGRLGRYPSAAQGGASWFGLIADTNFPTEGSDWHKFMENPPKDWQIFKQPGGMADNAENLNWLTQTPETLKLPINHPERIAQGRKYYERMTENSSPDWVRRYVHAQYGADPSGTVVFRDSFSMSKHVVDEIIPLSTMPLYIGQDFGRDPCSIIVQPDHRGCLLVLEEVIAKDVGLEVHVRTSLKPALKQERYLGRGTAVIGDPSGAARGSIFEETTFDFMKNAGFSAFPAPTNDIEPRIRAVEGWLMSMVNGEPAVKIDRKRCPTLIQALSIGYRYSKLRSGQTKPMPDKNEFSHIMDAFQYACLAAGSGLHGHIQNRLTRRPAAPPRRYSAAGWT